MSQPSSQIVGSLDHQGQRGGVNPGASSTAFSGLTPRARARPAGTLDWCGRACPAAAASATHHSRVPTHAVTRREGSGLRPRTGLGNRGEEERKQAWRTPPRRCPLGTTADPGSAQRQLGRTRARSRARGPGWPEQPRKAGTDPHRAACTVSDPEPSRTYLAGGVSRTGRQQRWRSSRGESPRPARASGRELSSRSSTAPFGPRWGLSPPAGSSWNCAAKVAGRTAARFPLSLLSLSLPGSRKVALSVPESMDHPHQAGAAP